MQYREWDELYRPRRRPWAPVVAVGVVALVILGVARLRHGPKTPDEEPGEAPSEPVAQRSADRSPAPAEGRRAAPPRDVVPSGPPYPADALQAALAEARAFEASDRLQEAREVLLRLLEDGRDLGRQRAEIETRLGAVHIRLATTPRAMPEKVEYIIESGDSLSRIAARFNTPVELIQTSNRIADAARIRPGDVLRVMDRPEWKIVVNKRDNTLLLTLGGRFFKRYPVGTGRYDRTPTGTFRVRDKIPEPPWWHPDGRVIPFGDPDNVLGTRWLAIEATGDTPPVRGYGIHGTWDDASIGRQSSDGCVRMHNADVEELHMLVPRGTPVEIHGD